MAVKPDLSQPELPAPDEKLLRAPTFFEKYGFLKSVLIVAFIVLIVDIVIFILLHANQQQTNTMTPAPTPQMTQEESPTWQTYINEEGNFMFQYPQGVQISENLMANPPRVTVIEPTKNVQLAIQYKTVDPSIPLTEHIAQNKLCPEMPAQGRPSLINDTQEAQLYMNTQCGALTKTIIYTLNGSTLYTITIDTPTKYEDVKTFTDQIIATLKFREPTASSVPSVMPSTSPVFQACTMDAKLCPDGSSVGRTGPNCEFAPCPRL